MLFLEATRDIGNSLRVSVKRPFDPISSYAEVEVDMARIDAYGADVVNTLNRVNRLGIGGPEVMENIQQIGRQLSDELLPPGIRQTLRRATDRHLLCCLDDRTAHIPWELLCLDEGFLCERFALGRSVQTRRDVFHDTARSLGATVKLWIVADPKGDLASARSEGLSICDDIDQMNGQEPEIDAFVESAISVERLKKQIRSYDVVHFAGHAVYKADDPGKSGWELMDGHFRACDVKKMAGGGAMPALVFSNACQSARTGEWAAKGDRPNDSFGLANAFMMAGVNHYIGAAWEIMDAPSGRFARQFYRHLFSGETVGEAMKFARKRLLAEGSDACWASYVLYGDPSARYFGNREAKTGASSAVELGASFQKEKTRSHGPGNLVETVPPDPKKRPPGLRLLVALLAMGLLAAMGWFASDTWKESLKDSWTSRPLSVAVVFDPAGNNSEKDRVLRAALESELLSQPRFQLVDRMSLETILAELKLNQSQWMDPERGIEPGLLPADLFLFVQVNDSDPRPLVLMQLKDTRNGQVVDVFNEAVQEKGGLLSQKDLLSRALLRKLTRLYPLRGKIKGMTETNAKIAIQLNVGADVGVLPGQWFQGVETDLKLKVVSVERKSSLAFVESGEAKVGTRVELEHPKKCPIERSSNPLS